MQWTHCTTIIYHPQTRRQFLHDWGKTQQRILLFLPPLPSLLLSSQNQPPKIQLEGLGDRCKLPQWGLGQSPGRNRIWCILALKWETPGGNNFSYLPWNPLTKFRLSCSLYCKVKSRVGLLLNVDRVKNLLLKYWEETLVILPSNPIIGGVSPTPCRVGSTRLDQSQSHNHRSVEQHRHISLYLQTDFTATVASQPRLYRTFGAQCRSISVSNAMMGSRHLSAHYEIISP